MKLNTVLVVFKGSLQGTSGVNARRLEQLGRMHETTRERVERELAHRDIACRIITRRKLGQRWKADAIITIGGDGTFMAGAHDANGTPVLGVNSMPGHSIGFYCATTAKTFGAYLDDILEGRHRPTRLPLLDVRIEGKRLPHRAINDILLAARSPAEMVRYTLRVKDRSEKQRSSGIWFAAGPGSTAALCSAGGKKLPITSKRLQYIVREPYHLPNTRLRSLGGTCPIGARIKLISAITDARLYFDGPRRMQIVPRGVNVSIGVAKETLSVFL